MRESEKPIALTDEPVSVWTEEGKKVCQNVCMCRLNPFVVPLFLTYSYSFKTVKVQLL